MPTEGSLGSHHDPGHNLSAAVLNPSQSSRRQLLTMLRGSIAFFNTQCQNVSRTIGFNLVNHLLKLQTIGEILYDHENSYIVKEKFLTLRRWKRRYYVDEQSEKLRFQVASL